MKQSQNKLTNEPILEFSHNYHFMVTNLVKVTSMRIEKFRASLGRRPGGEQSFIWGRYNLFVNYQVYEGEKEREKSKEFSRGFSFALNDGLLQVEEIEEMVDENLRGEFSFSHGVRPISFGLLPLLSKVNYIPFKIDVTVNVSIVNLPFEVRDKENCAQKEKSLPEKKEERLEDETSDDIYISPHHEPDLISQKKKKRVPVPFPNSQYYKKHQLYYDYFFQNSTQKGKEHEGRKKN